jgi:hypothetical protein
VHPSEKAELLRSSDDMGNNLPMQRGRTVTGLSAHLWLAS